MKATHDDIVALLENVRIRQAIVSAENGNHRSKESIEETLEMLGRSPFYSLKEKESIESKITRHL